ncbi:MAG TPA: sigma-70 family RNA polymerase sigma factor [Solirubrobacterales bacterium]|nr:sigma-70 family RNA polymerase sigma factor [Solirubrobacterales bacterium]
MSIDACERRRPVEREYARIVERHREELHAHSRRILRSPQDAEDALQEALLRAWRALPSFEGRSSLRSWLYRIVTNTSLDAVQRRRRVVPVDLEQAAPDDHRHSPALEPALDGGYLAREDFERALIVAMRLLPARQRAVLILREALGFSARETAGRLGISVAAANSYLQRARARVDGRVEELATEETARSVEDGRLRRMVKRHAELWERKDVDGLVAMLADDAAGAR